MFYIVETNNQLEELFNKNYSEVFIEPIYYNDNVHPTLNNLSLLYLKPLNNDKGYLICLNHSETFSVGKNRLKQLLNQIDDLPHVHSIRNSIFSRVNIFFQIHFDDWTGIQFGERSKTG